jgi:23S rRNA G2445 N2-methylase RlmL
VRYFATAIPGIAPILAEELVERGFAVVDTASDGRNDLVAFEARGDADVVSLRTAEDVYVEVSSARRSGGASGLAKRLLPEDGLGRALSVYGTQVRPLGGAMTVRAIARVLSEQEFRRTDLRNHVTAALLARRPRWRVADPAQLEVWALEGPRDRFRTGLRLTTAGLRHRGGRERERAGALRPTVAAAMVRLSGGPGGLLYDPFCGSGTILREAAAAGWEVAGSDIDPDAIDAARRNGAGPVSVSDAHKLAVEDAAVAAVVTNLPFGSTYALPADPGGWFTETLSELARIVCDGAAVVLLVAPGRAFASALGSERALVEERRLEVELLGKPTALRQLRRRPRA